MRLWFWVSAIDEKFSDSTMTLMNQEEEKKKKKKVLPFSPLCPFPSSSYPEAVQQKRLFFFFFFQY